MSTSTEFQGRSTFRTRTVGWLVYVTNRHTDWMSACGFRGLWITGERDVDKCGEMGIGVCTYAGKVVITGGWRRGQRVEQMWVSDR